jgi:hypothetical protein
MSKSKNWWRISVSIVGGWWSLMSGAVSIPFAFLAIVLGGKTGFWFAVLAFVALWVFAIRTAWRNYQLTECDPALSDYRVYYSLSKQDLEGWQGMYAERFGMTNKKDTTA